MIGPPFSYKAILLLLACVQSMLWMNSSNKQKFDIGWLVSTSKQVNYWRDFQLGGLQRWYNLATGISFSPFFLEISTPLPSAGIFWKPWIINEERRAGYQKVGTRYLIAVANNGHTEKLVDKKIMWGSFHSSHISMVFCLALCWLQLFQKITTK